MFTASSERCTCTCRGKKKLLSSLSSSVKPEKSICLNFIWVSLLTIRQSQCTAGRMWWDFWVLMTVLLEPRLQCRRMFLGSVKLKKLSIVKAWIGSLSLKRRVSVHVCSIQYIKKKCTALQIHCVTKRWQWKTFLISSPLLWRTNSFNYHNSQQINQEAKCDRTRTVSPLLSDWLRN